jgi:predicted O-methyltransferase YrrM
MITITDPRIEEYLLKLQPENDPSLLEMELMARERQVPIVDRLVGRFLYLITRLKQPRLVVEMGSGFGYSAYWFTRAISISGKVVLTDYAQENMDYARRVFSEKGLSERADFRVGNAMEIGREYRDIDLLFIDLDKYQYLEAIETMVPHLGTNALVIADNTIWKGSVVEDDDTRDADGVRRFNEFMFGRSDFFTTMVPLRDGVLLAYRLA